jgi:hypothetical protein
VRIWAKGFVFYLGFTKIKIWRTLLRQIFLNQVRILLWFNRLDGLKYFVIQFLLLLIGKFFLSFDWNIFIRVKGFSVHRMIVGLSSEKIHAIFKLKLTFKLFEVWQFILFALKYFNNLIDMIKIIRRLVSFCRQIKIKRSLAFFIFFNRIWLVSCFYFLLFRFVQLVEVMGASYLFITTLSLSLLLDVIFVHALIF